MQLIDTHCHLYLSEFKNDLNEVIQKAAENNVSKFFMPAIDSTVINDLLATEKIYPDKCFAMMGLHPCSVGENYKQELAFVEKWLQQRSFIAIGEIGLDFYWNTTFSNEQYEVFETQLQWALQKNRPVVIHTRNAMQRTIDVIKPFSDRGLRGVFHCFGDSLQMAKQIIDMHFYLGIGGVLTYRNSGLAEVIKQLDLQHIVLETDAPYLAPVPYRGKRNESSYIKLIAERLANIKDVTLEEVAAITTANAEKIFGKAG